MRAGMVFPAVPRDPARDPEQAPGHHRLVCLDCGARFRALTQYLEGAFGAFLSVLQAVHLDFGDLLHRPRLSRFETAGGWLCNPARILTVYYFFHFLVILPLLSYAEKPWPLPALIAEAVLKPKKA